MKNIVQAWRVLWGRPRYRLAVRYTPSRLPTLTVLTVIVECSDYQGYTTNGVWETLSFMNAQFYGWDRFFTRLVYSTDDRLTSITSMDRIVDVVEL